MTGRRILAFVAIAFGLLTVFAGGRVLAGADPGYVVFRPLLVFNFAMGFVYVAAGVAALRSAELGKRRGRRDLRCSTCSCSRPSPTSTPRGAPSRSTASAR